MSGGQAPQADRRRSSPRVSRHDACGTGLLASVDDGAHLVGFSYGGLVALVAAGSALHLVRSLAIIEPPVFALARDTPAGAHLITALDLVYVGRDRMTPDQYYTTFLQALGQQTDERVPLPAAERQAAAAAQREAVPWAVDLPLDALAGAPFPKLVVSGGWSELNEHVCDVLAARIRAARAVITGTRHGVQKTGGPFNAVLERLWQRVGVQDA